MRILSNDIKTFTFNDIVNFCNEGIPEGVEIDYKEDLPSKGLSKLIAAFSNTHGGVLIIGVKEDRTTGLPIESKGIDDNAKLIEQIYQNNVNINPIPNIIVHKTDNNNGKVFILIRVFEGEYPPYYVQNESNIWVRTGNITNPISLSSPDYLEFLIGKRNKADKSRVIREMQCTDLYKGALLLEEKRRLGLIMEAKKKNDGSEKNYFQDELGSNAVLCETILMPFYPAKDITNLSTLKNKLADLSRYGSFPDTNLISMPGGLYSFSHNFNGLLSGQQFYANGVIDGLLDVLRIDPKTGHRNLEMFAMAWNIYHVLNTAKSLYSDFGYNGMLSYKTKVTNIKDVWLRGLTTNEIFLFDKTKENLLDNYSWEITFSSQVLKDSEEYKKLFKNLLSDINWSFGFGELNDAIAEQFVKNSKMAF